MFLDQRSTAILSHIVYAGSYVPVKELMEKFKISRRTVYYDIEKINGWLKNNKLAPIKHVRGAGFSLEEETANKIPKEMELSQKWDYEYSAKERKAWLALYLLGRESPLFLEDLMEKVRVSRNTTIEDLKVLKDEIERFLLSLEFERKSGYTIIGNEENKRKAIVYYLSSILPNAGWQTLLSKIPTIIDQSDSNGGELPALFNYEELKAVQNIVSQSEKDLNLQFTDDFFYSLTFRLLFFGKRLVQGKNITIDNVEKEVLSEANEFLAARNIAERLSSLFRVKFPQDEIFYITKHLLSSRIQSSKNIWQEQQDEEAHLLTDVVGNMVIDFQKYACVFFEDRKLLEKNLLLHVKPSYYRIKYGLEVENQVAELIKEKYFEIFQLTKKVIHHLEKVVGKPINENEIALISMHFGGWMKRSGVTLVDRKKVLIVCASGLGTSKLLEHQLEGLFSTIDVVGSVALREYENHPYDVDFVISTTPVERKDIPVFVVSPILTETEKESLLKKVNALMETETKQKPHSVDALMDMIKKYAKVIDQEGLEKELRQYFSKPKSLKASSTKPSLRRLLTRDYIQFREKVKDWQEAIRIAASPLIDKRNIEERYIESMIDNITDLGPYIVIAPKVAIPHAKPEDGVRKLGMSLLSLENSVSFSSSNRHDVNLVIVLAAVDEEMHLKALSELTTLFTDSNNLERILAAQSEEVLIEMIDAYSQE